MTAMTADLFWWLDEGTGQPVALDRRAPDFAWRLEQRLRDQQRRVALDILDGEVEVSTVFLFADVSHGEGPPELFETLILGGALHETIARYATVAEALAGHARLVQAAEHARAVAEAVTR